MGAPAALPGQWKEWQYIADARLLYDGSMASYDIK
jgi:hypothetical protein